MQFHKHEQAEAAAAWPSANALVASADNAKLRRGRNVWWRYEHRITYEFFVGPNLVKSVCSEQFGDSMRWDVADYWLTPEEAAKHLPSVGSSRPIRYNPNNPAKCTEEVGVFSTKEQAAFSSVHVVFALFGVAIAASCFPSYRNQFRLRKK
jgi:hypothetical protein